MSSRPPGPLDAAFEEPGDAVPPVREAFGVVVEEREVVDVAQVALRPQDLLAEVVQAVEVHVGEEPAGQVADGQATRALEEGLAYRTEGVVDHPVAEGRDYGSSSRVGRMATMPAP